VFATASLARRHQCSAALVAHDRMSLLIARMPQRMRSANVIATRYIPGAHLQLSMPTRPVASASRLLPGAIEQACVSSEVSGAEGEPLRVRGAAARRSTIIPTHTYWPSDLRAISPSQLRGEQIANSSPDCVSIIPRLAHSTAVSFRRIPRGGFRQCFPCRFCIFRSSGLVSARRPARKPVVADRIRFVSHIRGSLDSSPHATAASAST